MVDNTLYETLIKFILTVTVILIIGILLIKRFLYFRPSSHFMSTKETYKTIRHGNLHGWLLEHPNATKIILLCHGNAGNISYKEEKMIALRNLGYSVLAFDYSGYGKSTGIPSEQTLYDDASSMVALLRETYSPDNIVLYGESIGGPVATYAARRYSVQKLILEAPLPSMKVLIQHKYPILGYLASFFTEFDTSAYLNGYSGKSLIMHSPTDEIIPYLTIAELLKMCTNHIQLDGSHNNPIIPWKDVQQFIEQ
jgi:fermentation-respiration switch protein FrsA (DUF1100 family)